MRVILAGFGPFPGAPVNPSAVLVKLLVARRRPALSALKRSAHVFATSYAAIDRELPKLLAQKPDVLLIFGVAGRRREICIEMRARNAVSVLFPDSSGQQPARRVIEPGGPSVLTGRAPFMRLLGALRGLRIPARLSCDAGTYLCNYAYWRALRRAPKGRPLVLFIHIPAIGRGLRPRRSTNRATRGPLSFAQFINAGERLVIALAAVSKP
jgi:pyroglutamyl-peptidase